MIEKSVNEIGKFSYEDMECPKNERTLAESVKTIRTFCFKYVGCLETYVLNYRITGIAKSC